MAGTSRCFSIRLPRSRAPHESGSPSFRSTPHSMSSYLMHQILRLHWPISDAPTDCRRSCFHSFFWDSTYCLTASVTMFILFSLIFHVLAVRQLFLLCKACHEPVDAGFRRGHLV